MMLATASSSFSPLVVANNINHNGISTKTCYMTDSVRGGSKLFAASEGSDSTIVIDDGHGQSDPSSKSIKHRFVIPLALLGATASIYSSLLRNSVFTKVSSSCMLLYALQVSLQPTLTKRYIPKYINKQKVALLEETLKTAIALLFFWSQTSSERHHAIQGWTLLSSVTVAGIPAAIYALQAVLTYKAQQHLDAVTFNGISQAKTVSAGIFCFLLLGENLSLRKWISIIILCVSTLVFQGNLRMPDLTATKSRMHLQPRVRSKEALGKIQKGLLPCVAATFLSGLAGAMSQKGLQMVGTNGSRNAYIFTAEVSLYSIVCLLVSMGLQYMHTQRTRLSLSHSRSPQSDMAVHSQSESVQERDTMKTNYKMILIPITVRAVGGLLTALLHKHAGTVMKGFAMVLGLVFSGLVEAACVGNLSFHQILGTMLVLLSSWMHLSH